MKTQFSILCLLAFILLGGVGCSKDDETNEGPIALPVLPDPGDVCSCMDDLQFMKYCYEKFDINKDAKVSKAEANAVFELNVDGCNIKSLTGIEYFTRLRRLNCYDNQLTSLNLSYNINLEELICSRNKLSVLKLPKNSVLTDLSCSYNQLSSLDITQNPSLNRLDCSFNELKSIAIGKNNSALTYFYCNSNKLTSLDIPSNSQLYSLECQDNQLTSLNHCCPIKI